MQNQKGNIMLAVILGIVFVVIILIATYFLLTQYYNVSLFPAKQQSQNNAACPQDAKICPDGSSVGRVAPNCDFAPCPNSSSTIDTTGWNTVNNNVVGLQLRYPSNFFDPGHEPQILTGSCNYSVFPQSCPNINNIVAQNLISQGGDATAINSNLASASYWQNSSGYMLNINGTPYCLYQSASAAMGQVDTSYYYVAVKNQQCAVVAFDVSTDNCQNYLPIEPGNTAQQQNYDNCIAKTNAQPQILDQVINTFQLSQ